MYLFNYPKIGDFFGNTKNTKISISISYVSYKKYKPKKCDTAKGEDFFENTIIAHRSPKQVYVLRHVNLLS